MHVQTGKISSSLRRHLWKRCPVCGGRLFQAIEALRRRTRGRRVSSEYVAQRWTATVPTSDQLCCWRWRSGRGAWRYKMMPLHTNQNFKRLRDPKHILLEVIYHACTQQYQRAHHNLKCLASPIPKIWLGPSIWKGSAAHSLNDINSLWYVKQTMRQQAVRSCARGRTWLTRRRIQRLRVVTTSGRRRPLIRLSTCWSSLGCWTVSATPVRRSSAWRTSTKTSQRPSRRSTSVTIVDRLAQAQILN